MKKILVTGGCGFIGSAVVNKLQEQGYDIYVYDNLSFGSRKFINVDDEKFFENDIRDVKSLEKCFAKVTPQWVIHLAAIHFIPYCNEHPYLAADININGTIKVLDTIAKTKSVEKIFFASTAAVYPIYDFPTPETHEVGTMDIYGLTKFTCEKLCNEFHLRTQIPTVICRFFNAFGPNETNPHLIPEIQKQILGGNRIIELGNISPKRDFIHTYDMVEAVHLLMKKFDKGIDIFNLGQGQEYAVTEVVKMFEKAIGEKIQIKQVESRIRKVERMHLLADITKLKNFAGWQPVWSLEAGIKTLVE